MRRFYIGFVLFLLAAVALESAAPTFVQAAEGGASAAKEADGDGFDLSPAIAIVGSIVIPALTFGAGYATDRKLQQRERNREQLALADEFLASSGKVVSRLEAFATGSDRADDVAPLQQELRQVSERSTKITDREVSELGQRFFDRTMGVLRAVASPKTSTQPAAMEAVAAFDDLRKGVGRFRSELSPKPQRARQEASTATARQAAEQVKSTSPREDDML